VAQGITKWPYVLAEAYRCLKPGGYVELSETGSTFPENHALPSSLNFAEFLLAYMGSDDGSLIDENPLMRWSNAMKEAMIASGRVAPSEELLRGRLEQAGYVDVQSFTLKLPFGPWAKDRYEPWTGTVEPLHTHTHCLDSDLKKLGMMMLLVAETGFHSYGEYTADCQRESLSGG
jgi:hypothetical protein